MIREVNAKAFGLKHKRACIEGRSKKERYMEYQDEYRAEYGVFPELDRIHNPFTAKWDDVYKLCCTMRKAGFGGALYYHDLHDRYRMRLRKIYEAHGAEWSFLLSIDPDYRTILVEIPGMEPGERIVNHLGYRKDENGNYYEGTWEGGKLVYGLVYLAAQDVYFVGSYDESGKTNCSGVAVSYGQVNKGKRDIQTLVGNFRFKNGEFRLYESWGMTNVVHVKNDEAVSSESQVGLYKDGYAEKTFLEKEWSDGVRIGWTRYRDGEAKATMSWIENLPRTLMMFYMLVWYLAKYVVASTFFITPLYYIIRRKTWRI